MRRHHTKEDLDALLEKVVARWKAQTPIEPVTPLELAARFGLSHVTVRRHLRSLGLMAPQKPRVRR